MSKLKCSCVTGFENMFLFFLWHGDIPTNNFTSNMLKNFSNSIHQNLWILVLWPSSGSKSKFNNWLNIYKYLVACHCLILVWTHFLVPFHRQLTIQHHALNFDSEMKMILLILVILSDCTTYSDCYEDGQRLLHTWKWLRHLNPSCFSFFQN